MHLEQSGMLPVAVLKTAGPKSLKQMADFCYINIHTSSKFETMFLILFCKVVYYFYLVKLWGTISDNLSYNRYGKWSLSKRFSFFFNEKLLKSMRGTILVKLFVKTAFFGKIFWGYSSFGGNILRHYLVRTFWKKWFQVQN